MRGLKTLLGTTALLADLVLCPISPAEGRPTATQRFPVPAARVPAQVML
jgi:hypothetical protein